MTASVIWLTIHLLGVGVLAGVVFISLYYVVRINSAERLKDFITLRKIGALGAAVAILAGVVMAWRWFDHLRNDRLFLTKIGLVLADGVIAELVFIRILKEKLIKNEVVGIKGKLLPWAVLSAIILIAIIAISVYRGKSHG